MSLTIRCKRGHDMTGDNVYVRKNGTRYCRACNYELMGRSDIRASGVKKREHLHKTHCSRGHELTPDNIVPGGDGSRRCKTCRRMSRNKPRNHAGAKPLSCCDYNGRAPEIIASRPSDDLIADARRRAAALHRSLASMTFGDPKIGYSALDRRQGA